LIKASLERLEDHLDGLKENVIIGKLIPAGTGFGGARSAAEEELSDENDKVQSENGGSQKD